MLYYQFGKSSVNECYKKKTVMVEVNTIFEIKWLSVKQMNENKDSRCGLRSLHCSIIQVVSTDWEQIDKCSEKG